MWDNTNEDDDDEDAYFHFPIGTELWKSSLKNTLYQKQQHIAQY